LFRSYLLELVEASYGSSLVLQPRIAQLFWKWWYSTAVALLKAQLDLKKKEDLTERSKALGVGRDFSNADDQRNKLQVDLKKCWKDYDDLSCQVRDTKSELV
jgi:hypothetical protein